MIRPATIDDLESIVGIYNQAIAAKFQTAYTEPQTVAQRLEWFMEHTEAYPLLVYVTDEHVGGWLNISPYRQGRAALRYTVELSYYVHNRHLHKGIGSQLLQYGVNLSKQLQYKTALAIMLNKNIASIKLAEKLGFEKWAYLPGIADFDGIECSHLYYGIKL